jgi:hypothetical protein
MAKIAYSSKSDNVTTALPEINKVTAANMNEIKTSVNAIYDTLGGFAFYEDATTAVTPIAIVADTWTDLTNDKAGSGTITTYKPSYVSDELWDTATNTIDLDELPNGKVVIIRTDFEYSPSSNNQHFDARLYFPDVPKELHFLHTDVGSHHEDHHFVNTSMFYVDSNIQTSDVKIQVQSSGNGSVKVNGFLISVLSF